MLWCTTQQLDPKLHIELMDAEVWPITHKQDYTSNSLNVERLLRGFSSRNYYG